MDRIAASYPPLLILTFLSVSIYGMEIQKIVNISLTSIDFDYQLKWNPVVFDNDTDKREVVYSVLASVEDSPKVLTNATNATAVSFHYIDKSAYTKTWVFTIIGSVDGNEVAKGRRRYFGFSPREVLYTLSPPVVNMTIKCGQVTVALAPPVSGLEVMRTLIYDVRYYDATSQSKWIEFGNRSKGSEYRQSSATIDFKVPIQIANVCIEARLVVFHGKNITSDNATVCEEHKCRKDIQNITMVNIDFHYFLKWNPVTSATGVLYNVSARVTTGGLPSVVYHYPESSSTTLEVAPPAKDVLRKWVFKITAIIDGNIIGYGTSRPLRGLTMPRVPVTLSPPTAKMSFECGQVVVTVALKERYPDMEAKDLTFVVEYFYNTSKIPFKREQKPEFNSSTSRFNNTISKTKIICVMAKVSVHHGGDVESGLSERTCAAPQCNVTHPVEASDGKSPVYTKIFIGIAVIAAALLIVLLVFAFKKYIWNPLNVGKLKFQLPNVTKQVVDIDLNDNNFATKVNEADPLTQTDHVYEPFISAHADEVPMLSGDGNDIISDEKAPLNQENQYDVINLDEIDRNTTLIYDNDSEHSTSCTTSAKIVSPQNMGKQWSGSVDSAFAEDDPLQPRALRDPINTRTVSVTSNHESVDEGYVRLPGESYRGMS